jgi:hypothetical protein
MREDQSLFYLEQKHGRIGTHNSDRVLSVSLRGYKRVEKIFTAERGTNKHAH